MARSLIPHVWCISPSPAFCRKPVKKSSLYSCCLLLVILNPLTPSLCSLTVNRHLSCCIGSWALSLSPVAIESAPSTIVLNKVFFTILTCVKIIFFFNRHIRQKGFLESVNEPPETLESASPLYRSFCPISHPVLESLKPQLVAQHIIPSPYFWLLNTFHGNH